MLFNDASAKRAGQKRRQSLSILETRTLVTESKLRRLTGVSVLAILELSWGTAAALLAGGWFGVWSTLGPPYYDAGGSSFAALGLGLAGVFLLLGILSIIVGYRMWSRAGWGLTLNVGRTEAGIAFLAVVLGFFVAGPEYGPLRTISIIVSTLALLAGFFVLWYLWRPHVRAYFGVKE